MYNRGWAARTFSLGKHHVLVGAPHKPFSIPCGKPILSIGHATSFLQIKLNGNGGDNCDTAFPGSTQHQVRVRVSGWAPPVLSIAPPF